MAELVLVLGGTRSGKSALAERLVAAVPAVTYVATLPEDGLVDGDLAARIASHRARRPPHWRVLTAPGGPGLAATVAGAAQGAVLVDGLGAWLAAAMAALGLFDGEAGDGGGEGGARLVAEGAALVEAARARGSGPVVVVAEEAGLGVVPAGSGTRRWLDLHGELVQALAAAAERVLLVVAGRALELPSSAGPSPTSQDVGAPRPHGDAMVPAGALDLAVNVWLDPATGGAPAHLVAAMAPALTAAAAYPDLGPATAAVAARHGRPAAEVLLVAGAAEGLWLVAGALGARLAAVVQPQFSEGEAALVANGVDVVRVARREADGWALDPGAVPEAADLVVVGNPNNPTGTLDDPQRVAALCRPGRVTLVDEAFMDFVPDHGASLAGRRDLPGLVVARSVTKLWGLAGIRAGWLLGPAELLARCAARRQPWPLSGPALAAIGTCARDEDYRLAVAGAVAAERAWLASALAALPGVRVHPGAANFLLLRVPGGPAILGGLARAGIAVRPPTFPGLGPDHLRVAVRDRAASTALVGALAALLDPVEAR